MATRVNGSSSSDSPVPSDADTSKGLKVRGSNGKRLRVWGGSNGSRMRMGRGPELRRNPAREHRAATEAAKGRPDEFAFPSEDTGSVVEEDALKGVKVVESSVQTRKRNHSPPASELPKIRPGRGRPPKGGRVQDLPSTKSVEVAVETPAPAVQEPAPAVQEPAPAVQEPVPAAPAPAAPEAGPAVSEPAPAVPAPAVQAPAVPEPDPSVGTDGDVCVDGVPFRADDNVALLRLIRKTGANGAKQVPVRCNLFKLSAVVNGVDESVDLSRKVRSVILGRDGLTRHSFALDKAAQNPTNIELAECLLGLAVCKPFIDEVADGRSTEVGPWLREIRENIRTFLGLQKKWVSIGNRQSLRIYEINSYLYSPLFMYWILVGFECLTKVFTGGVRAVEQTMLFTDADLDSIGKSLANWLKFFIRHCNDSITGGPRDARLLLCEAWLVIHTVVVKPIRERYQYDSMPTSVASALLHLYPVFQDLETQFRMDTAHPELRKVPVLPLYTFLLSIGYPLLSTSAAGMEPRRCSWIRLVIKAIEAKAKVYGARDGDALPGDCVFNSDCTLSAASFISAFRWLIRIRFCHFDECEAFIRVVVMDAANSVSCLEWTLSQLMEQQNCWSILYGSRVSNSVYTPKDIQKVYASLFVEGDEALADPSQFNPWRQLCSVYTVHPVSLAAKLCEAVATHIGTATTQLFKSDCSSGDWVKSAQLIISACACMLQAADVAVVLLSRPSDDDYVAHALVPIPDATQFSGAAFAGVGESVTSVEPTRKRCRADAPLPTKPVVASTAFREEWDHRDVTEHALDRFAGGISAADVEKSTGTVSLRAASLLVEQATGICARLMGEYGFSLQESYDGCVELSSDRCSHLQLFLSIKRYTPPELLSIWSWLLLLKVAISMASKTISVHARRASIPIVSDVLSGVLRTLLLNEVPSGVAAHGCRRIFSMVVSIVGVLEAGSGYMDVRWGVRCILKKCILVIAELVAPGVLGLGYGSSESAIREVGRIRRLAEVVHAVATVPQLHYTCRWIPAVLSRLLFIICKYHVNDTKRDASIQKLCSSSAAVLGTLIRARVDGNVLNSGLAGLMELAPEVMVSVEAALQAILPSPVLVQGDAVAAVSVHAHAHESEREHECDLDVQPVFDDVAPVLAAPSQQQQLSVTAPPGSGPERVVSVQPDPFEQPCGVHRRIQVPASESAPVSASVSVNASVPVNASVSVSASVSASASVSVSASVRVRQRVTVSDMEWSAEGL